METIVIDVPSGFDSVIERSLIRLRARFARHRFERRCEGIFVLTDDEATDPDQVRSAVLHTLYRERIFTETLSMRETLLAAVMR